MQDQSLARRLRERRRAIMSRRIEDLPASIQEIAQLEIECADAGVLSETLLARIGHAMCLCDANRFGQALAISSSVLAEASQAGLIDVATAAMLQLGVTSCALGDLLDAIAYLEEARESALAIGDEELTVRASLNLANALNDIGQRQVAIDIYEEALAKHAVTEGAFPRIIGCSNVAGMYVALAQDALEAGEPIPQEALDKAQPYLDEVLAVDSEHATPHLWIRTLTAAAKAAAMRGDAARAAQIMWEHKRLSRGLENALALGFHYELRATLKALRGEVAAAARLSAWAAQAFDSIDSKTTAQHTHRLAARRFAAQRDFESAYRHLCRAQEIDEERQRMSAEQRAEVVGARTAVERTRHDLELLRMRNELLSTQTAELDRLAHTDQMTGVMNRRGLEREAEAWKAKGQTGWLAVIDLDRFKRINDRFGHEAGDEALIAFAEEAQRRLGAGGVVARSGGEEFVLLVPTPSEEHAFQEVDAIRAALAERRFPSTPQLKVTLSAGLTEWMDEASIWDAVARADHLLYQAKVQGRNRVLGPTVPDREL